VSVDIQRDTAQFTADPLRVSQVISNLLTNAAKYTDLEGQIRLVATCENSDVVVRVADSGIGISADTLPLIFNMFWQAHSTGARSEGGLGIGLALAKRIVELHGGRIEAQSAGLGGGSEFVVKLPRSLNTAQL
jgi:signal transduction histidine kinase